MTDYFTDEELEQIQAYMDFLLEIGTILGSKKGQHEVLTSNFPRT
jgi:predicted house-cleaning noncanonical NTP pyrophosphatase (MazG superfamily)